MRVCSEELRGASFSGDDVSSDEAHRLGVLGRDEGRDEGRDGGVRRRSPSAARAPNVGVSGPKWDSVLLLLFALAFTLLLTLRERVTACGCGGNTSSCFPSCGVVNADNEPFDLLPGRLPKLKPLLERVGEETVSAVAVAVAVLPLLLEDFKPELLPGLGI
jgi:hypothetical protein